MSFRSLRRRCLSLSRALSLTMLGTFTAAVQAQVNVTMYHNDIARTGANTQETILTTTNVNSTQFGKLFSVTLDGQVFAQPLYLSNVSIAGGTHNVVYLATEHDSVYAIDADSGTVYAQASLIPAGATTANSDNDLGCTDIVPEVGITGTPVIDPTAGILYVVAVSNVGGNIVQYLHALNVTTLSEALNGPVKITAAVSGAGVDSSGGQVIFNAKQEHQRAALLLENGHVVIAWGSHCDINPWHGWVMSYSASTLAQEGVFNTSPNGEQNGVWVSGGGVAADASGNLYFPTGNGTWNGSTDYGDSIVKLGPPAAGTFPVLDYFTPYNQATLSSDDNDVSAGGLVLLPALPTGAQQVRPGQQLIAQQGKLGTIVLLNSSNLGRYCVNSTPACSGGDTNIVQELPNASSGIWGSPAYWNGNLYWTGANDPITAWSFNAGGSALLSTSPVSQSAKTFAYSAPTPAISSNGTANAILWALDGSADASTCDGGGAGCLALYAYDATNLNHLLYSSTQAASNRDSPGVALKFEVPVIANGKVYVGTSGTLAAYGLLTNAPQVATPPTFSPLPGAYASASSVTLADTTPGAVIHYTIDGSTPTVNSPVYGAPIAVSNATVNAIAVATGYANSTVASASYSILGSLGTPTGVSLTSVANVSGIATDGTPTTNGGWDNSGYAYSSTLLGASVVFNGSTFTLGTPGTADAVSSTTIPLPAGNYTTLNLLGSGTNGAQVNQTLVVTYTDGTTSVFTQTFSDWWWNSTTAPGETLVKQMAYNDGPTGAQNAGQASLYGYSFTLNSAKFVKSLTLPANRNVMILGVALSNTAAAAPPVVAATPTFSPVPGTYSTPQSVAFSDKTPGAVIYYTTDGTPPTANSTKYTAPITVGNETLRAIAIATGYTNSNVASGAYTITGSVGTQANVNLSAVANVYGIATNGTATAGGGWDTVGNAYSSNLLGTSISFNGSTFTLGAPGVADAVSSTTIPLPAGSYTTLNLLGSGTNGTQANQTVIVTYTDGTTSTFTQTFSNWWWNSTTATGETLVLQMPYLVTVTGAQNAGQVSLYGYSFTLNSAKTVQSLTLPANPDVSILGAALSTTVVTAPPVVTATPTLSPAPGAYTSAQLVTLSDTTPGAVIYYTTDGSPPTTSSTKYSAPITVSNATVQAIAIAAGDTASAVASGSYSVTGSVGTPVSVSLTSVANVVGIAINGTANPTSAGWDGDGNSYSSTLLGTSITFNGSTFTLGTPGVVDAVSSTTIPLPVGNYTTLNLLGSAVNGTQANQTLIVTYTDGTTSTFTQSFSDWWWDNSKVNPGETVVLQMPYDITTAGAENDGQVSLYGYSFALNGAKAVKSLTLPTNRNVSILGVALGNTVVVPPPVVTATPTLSPAPGAYTVAQSVTLSDTTPGAVIYYTTNGTAPTTGSLKYSAPITVSNATIQAIAIAAGDTISGVASGSYSVTGSAGAPTNVSLAAVANVNGISNNGTGTLNNGWDGDGNAYAANLLGTSVTYNGSTFTFGAPGAADAVSSTTIPLPVGYYSTLNLLGSAVDGSQANQTLTVTYTDGTTSTFTQSFSDWWWDNSKVNPGETVVLQMPYNVTSTGAENSGQVSLYGYTFALNSAKAVKSLTLPNNRDVSILGIALTNASAVTAAATPTFSPAPGAYAPTQTITLSDTTPGAVIYYTTNGTPPTAASTKYTAPFAVSNATVQAIAIATGYTNSAVASGTYSVSSSSGAPGSVSLASVANRIGYATNGSPITGGGWDNNDYGYSATLLGHSVTYNGSVFTLGTPGVLDAVSSATIPLPAGQYTTLSLIGSGVNGAWVNQVLTVTYTDGTTSTFTQSFSDWNTPKNYSGESIVANMAYRVTPTGATQAGPWYLYGYSFALNASKTVKSVTLPNNIDVSVLGVALSDTSVNGVATVSLSAVDNRSVIATNGTRVGGVGGNDGYAYSATLLGTSITWAGETFTLGAPTAPSAVTSTTIPLPTGNFASLSFIGTGVYGNQLNQAFIVTYTDGTSTTFTQSLSDWGTPQQYAGESIVATDAYRVTPTGATGVGPWNLYGYSFALNAAKTVKSLTLPNNGYVLVLGVDLSVNPAPTFKSQSLSFGTIATQKSGTNLALAAKATSGLTPSYLALTPTVCSVTGSTVTMLAAGSCDILALQTGNSSYSAAVPVSQSFTVTK